MKPTPEPCEAMLAFLAWRHAVVRGQPGLAAAALARLERLAARPEPAAESSDEEEAENRNWPASLHYRPRSARA